MLFEACERSNFFFFTTAQGNTLSRDIQRMGKKLLVCLVFRWQRCLIFIQTKKYFGKCRICCVYIVEKSYLCDTDMNIR